MSEIASLGVRIDSTDATRAAGELERLTTAGTRSEEAAKRVQRSWEQAVQRTAAEMNALNGRVDVLNGTQSRMLAAVERTEAHMKRMAEAYDRSARAADSAARAYGQVGREAGSSAAGVDRVNRSLVQTETTATAAGASIRRHLLAALGGLSAMRLIDLADDWGQMASRIRMTTESADEYAKVQARMVASANTTYRSITETREAFVQLSPVLRQMGMTLDESMDAIDAFSGLMVTNAASTDRGAAAMRALSIALQKGKLDADGWITIYSTLDSLVDVLAQHSGKSAEEIRKLGAEGKLSVELIAQALSGSLDPIMRQVDEMPTTVRDAMGNVANAFSEYIGKANESNEVTATMAKGILLLGENMSGVLNVALVATAAGLTRYVAGMTASVAQTTVKAVQTRLAAAEEVRLAQAQVASATAAVAQARAMVGLTATMAQQTVAAAALTAANARLAAAQAAAGAAGSSLLGILAGPVGIAVTVGLAATAFMTMGSSANAASKDIDGLSASLNELNKEQLQLRQFDIQDKVEALERQATESADILIGLENDYAAVQESAARGFNITAKELENAKRALLEHGAAHGELHGKLDRARELLDQTVHALHNLDSASRGAAGGVRGLNAAMAFTEAGEKYLAQIQGRIKALQDGGDPVKAATRWILEHADASEADKIAIMSAAQAEKVLQETRDRAAKATKAGTAAINEAKKAAEAFGRERRQYLNGLYGEISALQDQARGLDRQIAMYGLAESATYDYTIAQLEREKAALMVIDREAEEIAILERKIELLGQMKGSQRTLERLDAEKAAWEQWSQDVEQIFDQVGQSLTDAIFDGGKSARDLVRDLFKTLTLRVLVQPVMSGLQGLFTGAGPAGVANAASAGGGMLGNSSSLFSMFGGNSMGMGISNVLSGLSTSSPLSGTGVGNYLMGLSGNVAGMSNLALGGAGLLGGLGAGLIFGNKGYSSVGGGLGATAGMVLGGPIGAVAGSLIGGGLGSLFGDSGPPKTRHGQRTTIDYAGGAYGISAIDDRQAAGSEQAALAAAQSAVSAANDLFARIGVNAGIESFYAVMESSVLGDRNGVASGGMLRIGDQLRQIGVAQASDMTFGGFGGWSSEDMLSRLQTDITLTTLEAFQALGDQLPSVLSNMLAGIDFRNIDAVTAQDIATRFAAVADGATQFLAAIEAMPFEQLRGLSFDAAAGLVQLAGGVEGLLSAQQTYYQAYYSEAERHGIAVNNLTSALAAAGVVMPELTGSTDQMLASYRAIVEAQDLNTEAGRQVYVALMQASGAFAEVAQYAGQAAAEVGNAGRTLADIARERLGLEGQLLQLQGNTAEIRRRELEALDESNHALQRYIWSLQDQQSAFDAAVAVGESAFSALSRSVSAEKSRLQKESQAIADALRNSISAASTTVNELTSLTGRLTSTVQRMIGQGLDEGRNRAWAQDRIDRALSVAKLTGVMPQGADFEAALSIVAEPSEGLFSSFEDYQADFLKTAHTISSLNELADGQLSTEKRALRALEDQLTQSQEWYRAEMERLDATLEYWRQQLDIANGTYQVELSQLDAINGVIAAIGNIKLVAPPAVAGGGAGAGGGGGYTPVPGSDIGSSSWTTDYLLANPDVLTAYDTSWGLSPEAWAQYHWDTYGRNEGRSYDVGTSYVPHDMLANIHRGEIIIDPRSSDILRRYGIGVQGGGSDQMVRLLQQEIREMRAMLERKLDEGNSNTRETARTNRQMVEQPSPVAVTSIVRTVAVTPGS